MLKCHPVKSPSSVRYKPITDWYDIMKLQFITLNVYEILSWLSLYIELRKELFINSVLYKTELDIAILIAAINSQCEVNYLGKHMRKCVF